MSVITLTSEEANAQLRRWVEHGAPAVVALCAAWCDTCTEFRATLERLAQARPDLLYVWLDIEDDSEVCGDIDIENFPTLAIYRGRRLLHFGVSLPQEGTVRRLIDEIATRPDFGVSAPQGVLDLPGRLLAKLPRQTA
jgi:thioredoxin 1